MRQFRFIYSSVFALALLLAGQLSFAQSDQGISAREFGLGQPASVADLPVGQLRSRLESLPPQARSKALRWLQDFSFPAADVQAIKIDEQGNVFYADTFLPGPDEAGTASGTPTSYADVPTSTLDDVFLLHSKPGAANIVIVDFDGHVITGTWWNSTYPTLYALPYNTEGDTASFTSTERKKMVDIWHRVAEDLAPYDIDVTTQEPSSLGPNTGRILISRGTDANGNPLHSCAVSSTGKCGGVAYVNVFGNSNYHTQASPALVFYNNLGGGFEHYVAEAASHELGHNLGLSHDATSTVGYYSGHGSGKVSWAPIMGVGYYNNVTQWSKGEYAGANNTQDDLVIIDGKLGYDFDDHGDSMAAASSLVVDANGTVLSSNPALDPHNELPFNKGIIGTRDDVDVFWFSAGAGSVSLSVRPAWEAFYRTTNDYRGANLDIEVELLDSTGASVELNDPTSDTSASINATVIAGSYYLLVTGVGNTTVPYSDYGSLGQYFIDGTVPSATPDTQAPTPDPMRFAVAPYAISESAISMTASTATDDMTTVQYNFLCTPVDCNDSGWQSGTSYTATGLQAATTYSFQVKARDLSGNETALSSIASATTDTPPPPPPYTNFMATSDLAVAGTVSGSVGDTRSDDGFPQSITERESGGKPANRHSYLEHRWNFNISAGASVTVYANAWSGGSSYGDNFEFQYSVNGGSFQTLFIVSSTDDANLQSALIPGSPSGSITIRVMDTDQTRGNREKNTVFVDQLYIQVGNPSTKPPNGAPTNLNANAVSSSQVDLSWTNGSDNESGFKVERSANGSDGWSEIADLPAGSATYSDTGLNELTQYFYRVSAYNLNGASAFTEANTTTPKAPAISLTAAGFKDKGKHNVTLTWTGPGSVDVYRGTLFRGTQSGGSWVDNIGSKGGATYTHKVCVVGSTAADDCSNVTTTTF